MVSRALIYAPTAIKPACPTENSPIYPLIRFRLIVRMILIPMYIKISWIYGLIRLNCGIKNESTRPTASKTGSSQRLAHQGSQAEAIRLRQI